MSIEYFGTPIPEIPKNEINQLLQLLAKHENYVCVRQAPNLIGLADTNWNSGVETVTVYVYSQRVCVAFHSANGYEREAFIERIKSCLRKEGYKCDLDED